jgi:hypothetical protein
MALPVNCLICVRHTSCMPHGCARNCHHNFSQPTTHKGKDKDKQAEAHANRFHMGPRPLRNGSIKLLGSTKRCTHVPWPSTFLWNFATLAFSTFQLQFSRNSASSTVRLHFFPTTLHVRGTTCSQFSSLALYKFKDPSCEVLSAFAVT